MLGLLASKYGDGMIRWYVCISTVGNLLRYDSYDNDAEYEVVLKGLAQSQALFGLENGRSRVSTQFPPCYTRLSHTIGSAVHR